MRKYNFFPLVMLISKHNAGLGIHVDRSVSLQVGLLGNEAKCDSSITQHAKRWPLFFFIIHKRLAFFGIRSNFSKTKFVHSVTTRGSVIYNLACLVAVGANTFLFNTTKVAMKDLDKSFQISLRQHVIPSVKFS